jgi:thioredoxin reductase (NADPH)
MYNIAIFGSGPAGLTAALYTCRAGVKTMLVDGPSPGGQLMITTGVENFPGFPEGVQGPELMANMRKQVEKFGVEFIPGMVTDVDFDERPFKFSVSSETFEAESIIIATGSSARWLGLDSEEKLKGKGVSACATCDGFFFADREVAVVGGGDSAMEEALFLTRFAKKVTVIHRRDQLRASKAMQEKAIKNEKIEFEWDSVVEEILDVDAGKVTAVVLKNVKTGQQKELPLDGVFLAIGHTPATEAFRGKLELDKKGYIVAGDGTKTSVEGVFAAGDVMDPVYRQAVTAAGTGCMAAMDSLNFLENKQN